MIATPTFVTSRRTQEKVVTGARIWSGPRREGKGKDREREGAGNRCEGEVRGVDGGTENERKEKAQERERKKTSREARVVYSMNESGDW